MDCKKITLFILGILWLLTIVGGNGFLLNYGNTPGVAAAAPSDWPAGSVIEPAKDKMTLVLIAHPRCPCTRATLGELSRLMPQAHGRLTTYVLFVKPKGFPIDWEKTDLWKDASAIPDVYVSLDEEGVEAERFSIFLLLRRNTYI